MRLLSALSSSGLALFALVLVACGDPPPSTTDGGIQRAVILEVVAPEPALEGSILEVRGLGLDGYGASARLVIEREGITVGTLPRVVDAPDASRLLFELDAAVVAELGPGTHTLLVVVTGESRDSEPYTFDLTLVSSLPVALASVPTGEVHRNEVAVLGGDGIVSATEGEVTVRFLGTFTLDAGGSAALDVSVPVSPLERGDRGRGVVVLTTDLGGLMPGTFEGTLQLVSVLRSGERTESTALDSSLHFNAPELYDLDPTNASVGQILTVRGAGFLGGPERPDETTVIRLEGMFEPAGGGSPEPFGPTEIVPRWDSGSEVGLVLEPEIQGETLVARLFGHARGMFLGRATPIAIKGTEELEGTTVPFGFVLGPVRQVVHVRFLPGFSASLAHFGLANAGPEVEEAVRGRMEAIYADWNVDIRLEEPLDFARTAYSVLEVGGPDPNGRGLFGYDNTPGKDIGNVRLFDAVGGANAETQMDGYPGYGGVFVESFLYWSEHPDLGGERPFGAPDPDPLFDEVFDAVRAAPATRAEAMGEGDPDRVAAVARAIAALGSIIGETSSHELGHSFGMAQPFGAPTVYHNDFDGDGCLMDTGGDRPLGERMGMSGFTTTHFCYDHPSYLDEILGR